MNVSFRNTNSLARRDNERPNDVEISSSPRTTPPRSQKLPQLSRSIGSYSDEETTKSIIQRLSSTGRSRQDQDSSDAFGKTVVKGTASVSVPNATFPLATFKEKMMPVASDPTLVEAGPAYLFVAQKRAPAKFALGGSCSSCEQGVTVEISKSCLMPPPKKSRLQIGGFSEPTSTEGDFQSAYLSISESAIDSDIDDYVDDDSSDWEDTTEESGESNMDDKFFQRIEPNVRLVTRRSLITLAIMRKKRQQNLSNQAFQSASATFCSRAEPSSLNLDVSPDVSPDDLYEALWLIEGMCPSKSKPIIEETLSTAQPSVDASEPIDTQVAFSPRTTRRNMLATELTESLCRHLLWERQQKTSTANAVLKRRHTSHNVANFRQDPEKPCSEDSEAAISWNQYFIKNAFDGYHSKGW
ncbi:hypothetical protein MY4038_008268 [Beauveria bassiana]